MDARVFDIPRYLSTLPLFAALDADERQRLAEGCSVHKRGRGDAVFRVGEPCDGFHVVIYGQVKLFALAPSGQEKVIEIVGPGHSFGEALVFTDRPYVVNAQALVDTMLLTVGKDVVRREIERDPKLAMRMLAGLSMRLHGLIADVQAYSLHSGVQRVIGYLLRDRHAAEDDEVVTVSLPVSKATIASRLSLTPEYFSRVLHELEAAGLIEVDKRDIRILDPQRLAGYQGR
ncbi:MAG: Crp/Fnr family transcriptional regulator [Rubrivivax sp.]|nr:Crp/Fnr family transcriptional regulator [Rubrivivax sp.]